MKNKRLFICIAMIALMILTITIIIVVFSMRNDSLSVRVVSPSGDTIGGSTKYEVAGASSVTEANKAIIKEYYNYRNDGIFRLIKDSEAQAIAEQITADGCGQIVDSYVGGPPVSNAKNWVNFSDGDYNIDVYMVDDEYLVQTHCRH